MNSIKKNNLLHWNNTIVFTLHFLSIWFPKMHIYVDGNIALFIYSFYILIQEHFLYTITQMHQNWLTAMNIAGLHLPSYWNQFHLSFLSAFVCVNCFLSITIFFIFDSISMYGLSGYFLNGWMVWLFATGGCSVWLWWINVCTVSISVFVKT